MSSLNALVFDLSCCEKSTKNFFKNSDFIFQLPALLIEIFAFKGHIFLAGPLLIIVLLPVKSSLAEVNRPK
jgi:hypothetical protein